MFLSSSEWFASLPGEAACLSLAPKGLLMSKLSEFWFSWIECVLRVKGCCPGSLCAFFLLELGFMREGSAEGQLFLLEALEHGLELVEVVERGLVVGLALHFELFREKSAPPGFGKRDQDAFDLVQVLADQDLLLERLLLGPSLLQLEALNFLKEALTERNISGLP